MNTDRLQPPVSRWFLCFEHTATLAVAILLFLLVPLTQDFDEALITTKEIRSIRYVPSPPYVTPPAPEPEVEAEKPPAPDLIDPPSDLNLEELQVSLNPRVGDSLGVGIARPDFAEEQNLIEDIKEIFRFSDLVQAPRLIYSPSFQFPRSLTLRGVKEGTVVLGILIDETGKTSVERVVSTTHPELVNIACTVTSKSLFSITKVNGKAMKVRIYRFKYTMTQFCGGAKIVNSATIK